MLTVLRALGLKFWSGVLEFGLKALGLRSLGCKVCCCPPRW